MPLSKELIRQKLKLILLDVERLSDLLGQSSYEEIINDEKLTSLAERRLERIINRAIDINLHSIRGVGSPPPEDYTRSFLELGTLGIITPSLAQAIAPCVGARNILVHEYDDIDNVQFYGSLQKAVELFPQYVQVIENYISTH